MTENTNKTEYMNYFNTETCHFLKRELLRFLGLDYYILIIKDGIDEDIDKYDDENVPKKKKYSEMCEKLLEVYSNIMSNPTNLWAIATFNALWCQLKLYWDQANEHNAEYNYFTPLNSVLEQQITELNEAITASGRVDNHVKQFEQLIEELYTEYEDYDKDTRSNIDWITHKIEGIIYGGNNE